MSQETVAQNHERDQKKSESNDSSETTTMEKLAACHLRVKELEDRIRYLSADFENFRRNAEKERALWYVKAQGEVLFDMLSIVDDFDRALEVAHTQMKETLKNGELESWLKGFSLIREAFVKILDKYEIKEMSELKEFDPERHEALQQVESNDHASGQIVSVVKKGYLYKGTVLRIAQVIVAK